MSAFDPIRREYLGEPLTESDSHPDPFEQFARWFAEVHAHEADPTSMALATATRSGRPSVRTVLLKGFDPRGFVFYTNYASRKARDIDETGRASLLFFWLAVERQVRVDGTVERVAAEESDAYFATRPLDSRWSVYASRQSDEISGRDELEARFEAAQREYGDQVPRPPWWGGYRVIPDEFEFWQGRERRLHDRIRYVRQPDQRWLRTRLAP